MLESEIKLNPNPLVQYLQKNPTDFTKADLKRFIHLNGVKMVNFRYSAEDGKLKTLNFVIQSEKHLDALLSTGERVDGSNMFSFIEAGSSDLYVIPRFKTAFLNPFSEVPSLDILCSFYSADGTPLASSPEYILKKANQYFQSVTGFKFKAMGELEYYVIGEHKEFYQGLNQRGYHSSEPFSKYENLRRKAMMMITKAGGNIKYGHSEVGCFSTDTHYYEQQEIEFSPVDPEDAADQLVVAKWMLRMLGYQQGLDISFGPKISVGKAGSGLHIHMLVEKEGKNLLIQEGHLSDMAKQMIAGIMDLSAPLTAFGNTIPTSYFRLVPNQEAPTYICWGDRNRSALVRVPLGWVGAQDMVHSANPQEPRNLQDFSGKQTFEFRVPDGSADIYYLVAGLIMACIHGIHLPKGLDKAKDLYASGNIFKEEFKDKLAQLDKLPASCWESAERLQGQRDIFEKEGVFPKGTIDAIIRNLKAFNDKGLAERLKGNSLEMEQLVSEFLHVK